MEKLIETQNELKAPKNQYNKFGNYNYRNAEDILEAVKPILKKHGCLLTISDEVVPVGDRIYVKATATITDGKTEKHVSAWAREAEAKKGMDDAQITGSASSYARKYALNGLFLIDDTKDPDSNEQRKQANALTPEEQEIKDAMDRQETEKIDKSQANVLVEYAKKVGLTEDDIKKVYKVKNVSDLTGKQYVDCVKRFDKKQKENEGKEINVEG